MNTNTISLIRIGILLTLGLMAFIFILGEEQDESTFDFILHVLLDKSVGFLCILAFGRLYGRWSRYDKWIARYDRWNTKGLEK